jgi:hypothetical protein
MDDSNKIVFSRYRFPKLDFSGTVRLGIVPTFVARIEHTSMHLQKKNSKNLKKNFLVLERGGPLKVF